MNLLETCLKWIATIGGGCASGCLAYQPKKPELQNKS